jgi:EcsC protein family
MPEPTQPEMSPRDLADLRQAATKLEGRSFAMTVAAKVGMPVEALLRFLPERAHRFIGVAVDKALQQCLRAALAFGQGGSGSPRSNRRHKLSTAVTGAVGGFFGLPGLAVELPVTTAIMLHSIAGIAAREGEDLRQPEAALACLQVLAFDPQGGSNGAVESAYYATRAALAQVTRDAAAYVAQKGIAKEGAPALVSFLAKVAARFGLEVSEKVAAQLIPVAGAAGGMALNVLFTAHFQRLAEGHFTVRRLERKYGPELVHREYELVRPAIPLH